MSIKFTKEDAGSCLIFMGVVMAGIVCILAVGEIVTDIIIKMNSSLDQSCK